MSFISVICEFREIHWSHIDEICEFRVIHQREFMRNDTHQLMGVHHTGYCIWSVI